mmetsp:Transcript_75850/g.180171  ORF Transcript_75850/g.180171 Transcript_75850/m.180171 type:complete len:905 (+) Transcript_75850:244-2958(+)
MALERKLDEELEVLHGILVETDDILSRQLQQITQILQKRPQLLRRPDKNGCMPLHVAILNECHSAKIELLLTQQFRRGQESPAGDPYMERYPIHWALEMHPEPEILAKILQSFPKSAALPDEDGRLPIHTLLELKPFPAHFGPLVSLCVKFHPESCATAYMRMLPLHMCLESNMPDSLLMEVFRANRNAASVASPDGRMPLHIAVQQKWDQRILLELIEAYPAALLQKMPQPGGQHDLLILEYSMKHSGSAVMQVILHGGSPENTTPQSRHAAAYARAGLLGRFTLDVQPKEKTKKVRSAGVDLQSNKAGYEDPLEAMMRQRNLRSAPALQITVLVADCVEVSLEAARHDKVEALKDQLEEVIGIPRRLQRLTINGQQMKNDEDIIKYPYKTGRIEVHHRVELVHTAIEFDAGKDVILGVLKYNQHSAGEDNRSGHIPLHMALQRQAPEEVIEALYELHPAAVASEMPGGLAGEFPLHLALRNGYPSRVVRKLLETCQPSCWTASGEYSPHGYLPESGKVPHPIHMAIKHCKNEGVKRTNYCPKCQWEVRKSLIERCVLVCGQCRCNWCYVCGTDLKHNPEYHFNEENLLGCPQYRDVAFDHRNDNNNSNNNHSDHHDNPNHNRSAGVGMEINVGSPVIVDAVPVPESEQQATIKLLISKRCSPTVRCAKTGYSAIEICLIEKQEHLFNFLLSLTLYLKPEDLLSYGPGGRQALHVAVTAGASLRCLRALCQEAGDSLRTPDTSGKLPIHLAVCQASVGHVRELLYWWDEAKNARDGNGMSPLQLAVTHKAAPGVCFELARDNAKALAVKDFRGRSLLELAAAHNAPQHVIQDIMEASGGSGEVPSVNLLSGRWPQNRTAIDMMRWALRHGREQATSVRTTGTGAGPAPKRQASRAKSSEKSWL